MDVTAHIGEPGTRVVVSGVVISAERIETQWGNGTGIKLRNDAEGTFILWASSRAELAYELKPGDPLTVRATIDRYVERSGTVWCRITNGKVEAEALALV